MDTLFDLVPFDQDHALYTSRHRSDAPIKGYYHYHQGCELLYVSEGTGKIVVNRRTYEIEPGSLYWFQPFQLHAVRPDVDASRPYVRTVMSFDPVGVDRCAAAFPDLQRFFRSLWKRRLSEQRFDVSGRAPFLEAILSAFEPKKDEGGEQTNMLLLLQVIACLRNELGGRVPLEGEGEERTLRYSESVMQWIEVHFANDFALEALSESLHLSKNYVSRVFRQETGSSITDYLMARRIKEASKLLRSSDVPVERVGIEVGLPNASYFCHLFKRVVGVSPLQYRKRSQSNAQF
ncbi:AraC family transcriptional regulator [Paenibacillus sp.]|uniref:AraC family transcriptional regulator n=1 Tax=Paenibacillus sp. TaxID=58172 RepID=UPI00281220B0|nr:AraC family transcriptional regulator [Paenibacillus sp.]